MVAIMRPYGEIVSSPFKIKHTTNDIRFLIELIHSIAGESRIVMEHTRHYYDVLAHQLSKVNLFVSVVNTNLKKLQVCVIVNSKVIQCQERSTA